MSFARSFRNLSLSALLGLPAGAGFAQESAPPAARPDLVHLRNLSVKDDAASLLKLADIRRRQKDFEAVWTLATRALAAPDLADSDAPQEEAARRHRMAAHLLRVQAATKTGRGARSITEDVHALARAFPLRGKVAAATVAGLTFASLLALSAGLTRRRGERGPGGWLTAGWMGASPILLGIAIFHPVSLAVAALLLSLSVVFALAPSVRRTYFAHRPRRGLSGIARDAGWLLASLVAVILVGSAYAWIYQRIAGRPLENQFIRDFIRLDTPRNIGLSIFTIAIAIPFYEEVVYRGFLTDALSRRLPPSAATLCAAAAFGLVHGWSYAVPTAALGLAAGLWRLRERSLWLPIALHALFNGMALAIIALGN